MGSSKLLILKSQTLMADGKKSIKNMLMKPLQALFQKNKRKEKLKEKEVVTEKQNDIATPLHVTKTENNGETPYDLLLKKLHQLQIDKQEKLAETSPDFTNVDDLKDNADTESINCNFSEIEKNEQPSKQDDDDDLQNFSTVDVTEDIKGQRLDSQTSQSSEESGFAEKHSVSDSDDDNSECLVEIHKDAHEKDAKVEKDVEGNKNQKKLQKCYIKRGPIKNKRTQYSSAPYAYDNHNQVNEVINTQTLSGGQVIIAQELDIQNELTSQITSQLSPEEFNLCANLVAAEVYGINDGSLPKSISDDFSNSDILTNDIIAIDADEGFPNTFDDVNENFSIDLDRFLLTPPSSVNSNFLYSPQYVNDVMTLSPMTSPQSLISDPEQFKEIIYNECPSNASNGIPASVSPAPAYKNLTQFKNRQKELAKEFSKMYCCQVNVTPCKDVFRGMLQNLKPEERKGMCYKVADLDLQHAYEVLKQILMNLSDSSESKSDEEDDIQVVLFSMVCEKVLCLQKMSFVEQFGLNLLKYAVLRCSNRPVLTRYLVECIRVVTRSKEYQKPLKGIVFEEVDGIRDNVLIACVRAGDKCANVLRELVRCETNDTPLFDIHHVNTDGYTALHVCCAEHKASTPRAHTLHVLLQHGNANCWQEDRKGGETPIHLAVNSSNCDLDFVLMYFYHVNRQEWYELAHVKNRSNQTPLDYAKQAVIRRPATYPKQVSNFLERCRKTTTKKDDLSPI